MKEAAQEDIAEVVPPKGVAQEDIAEEAVVEEAVVLAEVMV